MGTLACLAVTLTALTLPRIQQTPVVGETERLRLLRRPPVLLGVLGTMLVACGGLMPYIYMAPSTMISPASGAGTWASSSQSWASRVQWAPYWADG
ncbi:hypothetical protein [Streptomyces chrestomyceticus]|uniref:hypothetical protein n=1 Tax=Streptomyces chrestomyceticus TaxID=68185 RepID=UPI0033F52202